MQNEITQFQPVDVGKKTGDGAVGGLIAHRCAALQAQLVGEAARYRDIAGAGVDHEFDGFTVDAPGGHIVTEAVALQYHLMCTIRADAAYYLLVGIALTLQPVAGEQREQSQGEDPAENDHATTKSARYGLFGVMAHPGIVHAGLMGAKSACRNGVNSLWAGLALSDLPCHRSRNPVIDGFGWWG